MTRLRLPLLAALALAVLAPFTMVPATAEAKAATNTASALRPLTAKQLAHHLSGEVYGFLPYWLQTPTTASSLRYDLLTSVAFFDVGIAPSGAIDHGSIGYRALGSSSATAVIRAAHAAGVRVDLTLANFGFADNRAFLRNPAAQRRAIRQTVALLAARGLDGVTVDFESVYRTDLAGLGRFVSALGRAIRARNPIGRVTVAVGASQAGVAMATAALAGRADRVLIMGYDYRTARSTTTGSTDPLVRRGGGMSLTWTLDLYHEAGLPMKRLILALPYYGMSWPARTTTVNTASATSPAAAAYPIRVSKVAAPATARHGYDPVEATAWVMTWDAAHHVWRQVYWDSPQALVAKFSLARTSGLAGVGLWALGYDGGSISDWKAIATVFQPAPAKPPKAVKKIHHKTIPRHHSRPKATTPKRKAAVPPKVVHKLGAKAA